MTIVTKGARVRIAIVNPEEWRHDDAAWERVAGSPPTAPELLNGQTGVVGAVFADYLNRCDGDGVRTWEDGYLVVLDNALDMTSGREKPTRAVWLALRDLTLEP